MTSSMDNAVMDVPSRARLENDLPIRSLWEDNRFIRVDYMLIEHDLLGTGVSAGVAFFRYIIYSADIHCPIRTGITPFHDVAA